MKVITLLLLCILSLCSASVLANPIPPSFFESIGKHLSSINPEIRDSLHTTEATVDLAKESESEILIPTIVVAPDACGQGLGSLDLTPDPGGPYTFEWSNGETTEDISGLVEGTYTVTITDVNGNKNIAMAVVGSLPPVSPISITAVTTGNTLCNGMGDGAIDMTVDPPVGPWTYAWSNGETTEDITDLPPGTYTVSVTYGITCTTTAEFTVLNLTNFPMLSPPIGGFPADFCETGNGSAAVVVNGGVQPYTYEWSNGETTFNIMDLVAGTYTVTVTGDNGCSSTLTGPVPANTLPVQISLVTLTPNTNCVNPNGSIDINVSPFAALITATYEWSNGETTQDITGLTVGDYTVTVTRLGTCTAELGFLMADIPVLPTFSLMRTDATCGMSNGATFLNILPGGAAGPYTYLWSSGETTKNLSNVPPGDYEVTVTAANGCTQVGSITVGDNPIIFGVSAIVTDQISCDTVTGQISLIISPGNLPFTWSTGDSTKKITNLAPGDYTVTVSAGGTCETIETYEVADQRVYPIIPIAPTPSLCGLPNGSADLTIIDGESPFEIMWSTGDTSQDLSQLLADTFMVTVTSAVGCSSVNTVIVPNNDPPLEIVGNVMDNISCAFPTGSVFLDVTTLDSTLLDIWTDTSLVYLWSNGQSTDSLMNLPGGNYSVTVSLGATCIISDTFDILDDALAPTISASGTPATCSLNNGAADLDVSGASAPYTFLWSNMATTEDLANLPPGGYSVTVTGANSCTAVSTVNVINNDIVLNITGTPVENSSCTVVNGAIDIDVAPVGAYTYLWSNGAITEDINSLPANSYTVTVSLGTCESTSTFAVLDNTVIPNLSPSITASICSLDNGAIDLTVSGPAAPFTFMWSNMATTEDIANLLPGNYTVTVTAANGCTASSVINVPNNSATFSLSGAATDLTNCAVNNGAIDLTVTPAGAFTFLWSNGEITEDLNALTPGAYTVSVTSAGACTATASFFVVDLRSDPVTSQSIVPELCGLADGSIDLGVTGGSAPFTYLWNGGQLSQDLTAISAGTYSVTVTDANGCTATSSATVPGNSISFALAGATIANTSCIQNNGSVDLTVNPPGAYTFLWSNAANSEDLQAIAAGSYTVTVSAGGNCTSTANFMVSSSVPVPALSDTITPSFCGQASGNIDITVTAGPAPYLYLWSDASSNQDLSTIVSGNYTVTVTAANGCTTVENYVVPEDVFTPAISNALTPVTSCVLNNGAIDLTINPPMAYTYVWSNGSITEDLVDIAAGNYTVTVSGGGTCTNTADITVASNAVVPILSNNSTAILCFGGNNGAIDLSVNSGTAPFLYNWSPAIAGNPEDPTGLVAGTYTVTVTDDLGCTSSSVVAISQPASAVQLQCSVTNPVSEPGFTDGAGSVTISGGTGPYFVDWSVGNSGTPVPAGNFPMPNLGENTYNITVTDANGCPEICDFTIGVASCATAVGTMENTLLTHCGPGCITAAYDASNQQLGPNDGLQFILHQGNSNQIVGELARAMQPSFCFDATTMTYGTTYYISAVVGEAIAGDVNIAGFCSIAAVGTPIQFNEKPAASVNQPLPITCAATQTALIGNSSIGGSSYLWTTVGGTIVGNPNQSDINAGAAGTYTLIVTANGCMDTTVVSVASIINQPSANIVANAGTVLDCNTLDLTLNGNVSGTMDGNTQWVSNGVLLGAGNTLSITAPGLYEFVVVDTLSFCADTTSISITQNLNPPSLSILPPSMLTCTDTTVTLTGSSQNAGVQFTWVSIIGTDTTLLGNGAMLPVSTAGTYYLFGTDPGNNCKNATTVSVSANQVPPVADAGLTYTLDCAGETAALNGSGSGAANLNFQWMTQDGHFVSGASTATPLIDLPGTYQLVVTNPSNGCSASDEVIILPEIPVAFASVLQPSCLVEQGIITIDSVTGLSDPILYGLNGDQPGAQNQFSNLAPGIYTIAVLGENGCSATVSATVETPDILAITLETEAQIDLGHSYQIDAMINIPTANVSTISWTPSDGLSCDTCLNPIATPNTSTLYTLTVTTDEGCEERSEILVQVDKTRHVYVPNVFAPSSGNGNNFFTISADPLSVLNIKSFQVFSRWGEVVYELKDIDPSNTDPGWDGTHKGDKLNPGVFVWQAVVEFVDGVEELFSGDVTLIR